MLDENDKKVIKHLVQKELDELQSETKAVTVDDTPAFLGAEEKYEELLKKLLSKL